MPVHGLTLPEAHPGSAMKPRMAWIVGGAAGNHTVTGVAIDDWIISVWHIPALSEGAPNTFNAPVNLSAEFGRRPTAANTINNTGGTATTGGLLCIWYDDASWGEANADPWA